MKPRRHDRESVKCECGHLAGHHNDLHGRPFPCRLCECEDFMTKVERRELLAALDEENAC